MGYEIAMGRNKAFPPLTILSSEGGAGDGSNMSLLCKALVEEQLASGAPVIVEVVGIKLSTAVFVLHVR